MSIKRKPLKESKKKTFKPIRDRVSNELTERIEIRCSKNFKDLLQFISDNGFSYGSRNNSKIISHSVKEFAIKEGYLLDMDRYSIGEGA